MNYKDCTVATLKDLCNKRNIIIGNKKKQELIAALTEYDENINETKQLITEEEYFKLTEQELIEIRKKRFGTTIEEENEVAEEECYE